MTEHDEQGSRDPRLRVLWGESPVEDLGAATQQAAARRTLALLRGELAPPTFDRARLRKALQPSWRAARTWTPWRWTAAAALLVCALLFAVRWATNPVQVAVIPGTEELFAPVDPGRTVKQADGSWRVRGMTVVRDAAATPVTVRDDGLLILRGGRAQLVTEGAPAAPTEIVSALEDSMRLAVTGPSLCALRELPGGNGVGLSGYAGAARSVLLRRVDGSDEIAVGKDMDALLLARRLDQAAPRASCIFWPDVSAQLPPVNEGEVLVRLVNDRVLRGYIRTATREGVQIQGQNETNLGRTSLPESILREEVSAWVPAETPRGRDVYARWLDELAPSHLHAAQRNWFWYLVEAEQGRQHAVNPNQFVRAELWLPEIDYRIERRGEEQFFQMVPSSPELGLGWELDESGKFWRIGSRPAPQLEPEF